MSHVDNYILIGGPAVELYLIEPLNEWLSDKGQGASAFCRVDRWAGGPKNMELGVWLAALNYVLPDALVFKIRELIDVSAGRSLKYFVETRLSLYVMVQHQESRPEAVANKLQELRLYGEGDVFVVPDVQPWEA